MSNHGPASTGQYAEFVAAVVRQLPHDVDTTTAQRWIENQSELQRALREALMSAVKPEAKTFSVTVDFSRSLKEMIVAGKFDCVNSAITQEHFPVLSPGEVVLGLSEIKLSSKQIDFALLAVD